MSTIRRVVVKGKSSNAHPQEMDLSVNEYL